VKGDRQGLYKKYWGKGGSTWKTEQCKEGSHKDSENRSLWNCLRSFTNALLWY